MADLECEGFCETFSAFLFGVFPFTKHTEKQREAMELANVKLNELGLFDAAVPNSHAFCKENVRNCVIKLVEILPP